MAEDCKDFGQLNHNQTHLHQSIIQLFTTFKNMSNLTSQQSLSKPADTATVRKRITHRTKIVATVGPACDTYDKLLELVNAGVNVFRLNFSHGSHEDKAEIIKNIRKINENEHTNISILGDLQGPKLRVGEIENNALKVEAGDILTFTNDKVRRYYGKNLCIVS